MPKKQKIILVIVAILIVVGLILVFIPDPKDGEVPEEAGPSANGEVITNQEISPGGDTTPPTPPFDTDKPAQISPEEKLKRTLKSQARSFAARYGSFSSDSNFQNLYELKDQMTARFWQEKEAYIKQAKPAEVFYGVTSKVMSVKLVEFGLDRVEFLVSCQRQETQDTEQKVLYQDIKIIFVKVGDNWLVDNATWQ